MDNKGFLSQNAKLSDIKKMTKSAPNSNDILIDGAKLKTSKPNWDTSKIKVIEPGVKKVKQKVENKSTSRQGVFSRINPLDLMNLNSNEIKDNSLSDFAKEIIKSGKEEKKTSESNKRNNNKTNKTIIKTTNVQKNQTNLKEENKIQEKNHFNSIELSSFFHEDFDSSLSEEIKKINIHRATNSLKVIFLGGVGEIGKNMMVVEYGSDMVIIDSGSSFPDDTLPGVDLVVQDITYLLANKYKIRGIVITHGHEDHIGSLPYLLDEINVPVYGSRLTLGLVENKLREFPKLAKTPLISIKGGDVIELGKNFKIEFINVCHSIAGSMALSIQTPSGIMVHTGDFKIDYTPIDNIQTDLARFAELGKKGVLLLTCESTNIERAGFSMSERTVGKTIENIFIRHNKSRIVIATFASNIHRLQQLLSLAEKYGRKVVYTGRSMINVAETAYKLGELHFNKNTIIDSDRISKYKDEELLILCTGSQGEPNSALTRMALNDFPKIKLGNNDTVIISASPIPGNEKSINNTINNLYKLGCEVIYHELADVHVSGHACQEEIKTIHSLVKPKYFIPVHGEYRHLKHHKDLALTFGMDEKNILLAEIGNRIEVGKAGIKLLGNITSGNRLIDGLGIGDIESNVMKERRQLAEDGLCVVIVGFSNITGNIIMGPEIITRGLVYSSENEEIIAEAKQTLLDKIKENAFKSFEPSQMRAVIKKVLQSYFVKKTKRRPMVLSIIVDKLAV